MGGHFWRSGRNLHALLCRQRGVVIAVPIGYVIEIMRPLAVESLQGMPTFVRGLSVVRGAPIPVIDAGVLLGGTNADATRWVSLRVGARSVALAVESVEGFGELLPESTSPLPPLLHEARAEVIAAIGALDSNLLLVLDATRILSEAQWRALEQTTAVGA